jgi:hypothetical protein
VFLVLVAGIDGKIDDASPAPRQPAAACDAAARVGDTASLAAIE